MILDLSKFSGRLPSDSQLFGVYQPLIGWRSRLTLNRLGSAPVTLPPFPRQVAVTLGGNLDMNIALNDGQSFRVMVDGTLQEPRHIDLFKVDAKEVAFDNPAFIDSLTVRFVQEDARQYLADHPRDDTAFWKAYWAKMLTTDALNDAFSKAIAAMHAPLVAVPPKPAGNDPLGQYVYGIRMLLGDPVAAADYIFNKEVYVARYLNSLLPKAAGDPAAANFPGNVNDLLLKIAQVWDARTALEKLDPLYLTAGMVREAVLSPIGIVHIFRQYFFEFETFLGQPVEHVWLSPGSTTEMIEISTRRVLQERTLEQFIETIQQSEQSTTTLDELSDAIKDENQKNTKLGSSLSGGVNILIANIQASGSASVEETQRTAREQNHKSSRQQASKLSSEIRTNFKSTFRTVTEVTDTRSKRYTITNSSNELVNYELRRKMRQVGVQMQDYGTQLCWQVYVDDPGRTLGLAQLVHVASKSDLSPYVHEPSKQPPGDVTGTVTVLVPVPNPGDRSNMGPIAAGAVGFVAAGVPGAVVGVGVYDVLDSLFGGGKDKSDDYDIHPQTTIHQQYKIAMPNGYQLALDADQTADDTFTKDVPSGGQIPIRWLRNNGQNIESHMTILNLTEGVLDMVVNRGRVTPGEIIEFQAKIKVIPTAATKAAVDQENTKIAEENAQKDMAKERTLRLDFVNGVKERIKFAAGITARKADDLREEERTIVYRALIQRLMSDAWSLDVDRKVAHLRSELIKSIFDVDRMLYFVAPEWWQPRLHESHLDIAMPSYGMNLISRTAIDNSMRMAARSPLGKSVLSPLYQKPGQQALGAEDIADWGGEGRSDNYLITEESKPAKLGSSLGWLLQLDGDNLRNAFLNAPWVQAIIPILPGKEKEALEWLKQAQVEGTDGLNDVYAGDDKGAFQAKYLAKFGVAKADVTIDDVLQLLADDVKTKTAASMEVVQEKVPVGGGGEATVYYLRQDKVFEKGFDPLQDGFRATPAMDGGTPQFEVFDQWIEILPTDQIVAVPVEYDAKTGFLK